MSNPKSYKLVWKTGSVFHNNVVKTNEHTKFLCRCFITKECSDDLRSTFLEFDHLTKKRKNKINQGSGVEPSIVNSDVLENLFSSQRGRCHGANTNPNILADSKGIRFTWMWRLPHLVHLDYS